MKRKYALFFVIFHFAFFTLEATVFSANSDGAAPASSVYASEPKATGTNAIDQLSSVDATNLFGTVAGTRIGKRFPAPPGTYQDILHFEKGLRPLPAPWPYTREQTRALQYGAQSKITFRVVDSFENPVSNATVHVLYEPNDSKDYVTDENGLVVISHSKAHMFYMSIEKEGYWATHFQHYLFVEGYDCVKDGRYLPWNPTVEVELRNKLHPVEMEWHRFEGNIPADGWIPFDMEKAIPAPPFGKGMQTNLFIREEIVVSNRLYRIHVRFPEGYGYQIGQYVPISDFHREYAVDRVELKNDLCILTSQKESLEEDSGIVLWNGNSNIPYVQFCYPVQLENGESSFRCGFATTPFIGWHDRSGQNVYMHLQYWISTVPGDTSIERLIKRRASIENRAE